MLQLGDSLPEIYKTKEGITYLFRGPSGYGKTEIAKKCCNYLAGKEYQYCLGSNFSFNPNIWVHLIDEVHLLEQPEVLYPLIDSGKYVFVLATNFDSLLPEALTNRSKNYIFVDYTEEELFDIVRVHATLPLREETIRYIIKISGGNPRIMIKTYLSNIELHFRNDVGALTSMPEEQLEKEIDKLHGIVNGLDRISRHYLDGLKELGGRASITLLASTLRLDVNTIKYTIEPLLLKKGYIKITNKGREVCQLW